MKLTNWLLTAGAVFASAQGFGASYELIRLTLNHHNSSGEYIIRCNIKPGTTSHETDIGGVSSSQSFDFQTEEAKVQRLAEAVKGIARPDFDSATEYTNWWVRTDPHESFKLLRSNLTYPTGQVFLEDKSENARALSSFMGINCLTSFGQ